MVKSARRINARGRVRAWLVAGVVLAGLATAPAAGALVRAAVTIDGPSSAILSLGGVAMAPDGTGGLVYLKLSQGEPHVFVSRFIGGAWQPPRQLDTGLPFDSSWPVIGAANHGRLVVVWAQSYAKDVNGVPFRRMYSATLKPGANWFGPQVGFDQSLHSAAATGDQAVSELYPSLAMSPGGKAYLIYRVVTDACVPVCANSALGTFFRPGDAFASYRLARLNGETWSVLGDVNRNPAYSVRPGTPANSPQVVIDSGGRGVVAFQEPDASGYDRIWARRIFGSSIGQILRVSARSVGTLPVTGDADAFTLAGGSSGAAAVAYRQESAPGSGFTTPRVLVSSINAPSDLGGADQFAPADLVDGSLANPGVPGLGLTEPGLYTGAFASGGSLQSSSGDPSGQTAPASPTPTSLGAAADQSRPGVSVGSDGSVITAWASADAAGRPLVRIDEDVLQNVDGNPEPAVAHAHVAAASGGPISGLTVAGAGAGDALVAFEQGQAGGSQIAATLVQAPPAPFTAFAPPSWVHPRDAVVRWSPAVDPLSPVSYNVLLDGVLRARGLLATDYPLPPHGFPQGRVRLDPRGLVSGSYDLIVVATDRVGQERISSNDLLRVDTEPPRVRVTHHGREAGVRLSDGPLGQTSGIDPTRSWVEFGDGSGRRSFQLLWIPTAFGLALHRYTRAGTFTVVIHAADAAGNRRTYRVRVRVP